MKEGLTEEELYLNDVTDRLHGSVNEVDDEMVENNVDGFSASLDLADIGHEGEHLIEGNEDNESRSAHLNGNEGDEITVSIGKKNRVLRVRRATVNLLGFIDLYKKGMDMLEKKDLKSVRFRKQKRKERNRSMRKKVCDDMNESTASNDTIQEAFDRLFS